MKLSVPTNWDINLVDNIEKKYVDEIYGKLHTDIVGGGRVAFALALVSKSKVRDYVKKVHSNDLRFNYLLNSTCLGNTEWSNKGHQSICKLIDWLLDIGVDSVTVSLPYLLQLIKKKYPQLKVNVSTLSSISSVKEARHWEDLGADRITLSVHKANRDFEFIRAVRNYVKCELQLIANLHCLKNCPFALYHGVISSHSSQSCGYGDNLTIDYPFIICSYLKLKDPVEFIRSGWIRPEDIVIYEEIGIERFKLVNRTMSTETIIRIVKAYSERKYEGNLLDLFSDPTRAMVTKRPSLQKLIYHFRPFSVNLFKYMEAFKLLRSDPGIYIDNRKLEGFAEKLKNSPNCNITSCKECQLCGEFAKKALKIVNNINYSKLLLAHERFLERLVCGDIFTY